MPHRIPVGRRPRRPRRSPPPIATYAAHARMPVVDNYEPVAWAEELVEPARAADHPRLACAVRAGGACAGCPDAIEAAVRYSDAGQVADPCRAAAMVAVTASQAGLSTCAHGQIGQHRTVWSSGRRSLLARGRDHAMRCRQGRSWSSR